MKDNVKFEIPLEIDIKSNKKELEEKSEIKLKNANNERKENKKLITGNTSKFKINKNYSLDYQYLLRKNINYKANELNLKNHYKNIKGSNMQKNIYVIIMIFFNLIIANDNNLIEYKFSNITLKIRGQGEKKILSDDFFNHKYKPDIIYINGNPFSPINYI